jgi:Kef-type K+ transport system membrane component KefB
VRRVAVLLVLFGVMFALQLLRAEPVSAAHDPMTLAAIGFVLLASFTLAELGSALTLPRVTGYILAGVALGPSAANVLSAGVVQEMRMFNALALGLIATGAGLELDVGEIRRVLRTLLGTIAVKVVLGLLLVGSAFVGIALAFPGLGLGTRHEIYALGLVLAVLGIGTSPSISLAVKTETRAKGRLMDLVLGAAVLKDLVVVVGLAIAVALSQSWLSRGQGGQESWASLVAKELGGSLLAGSVLGVLLIAYIRFVKAEMLLFVAAMILVVSEVGRTLHLELLLVFITAGFVVRNFSRHEHDLMPAVQMVSLPIFIVFFTIAGASVDLRSTLGILPLALALAVARAISFSVASRIGGRFGRERAFIRRSAWLGYLPQAGVTLGLVGLAAQQLPSLAERLRTIGMAGVAINLLLGPITLKRVLKQAGEVQEGERETGDATAQKRLDTAADPERSTAAPPAVEGELREISEIAAELESSELAALLTQLHRELSQRIDGFRAEQLEPWARAIAQPLEKVLDELDEDASVVDALHTWTALPHADDLPRRATACYELFSDMQTVLRRVSVHLDVPLEAHNRRVSTKDPAGVRFRKRRQSVRLFFRLGRPTRRVPTRIVARLTLEARLAGFALSTLSAWSEAQASLLTELDRARNRGANRLETRQAVGANLSRFLVNFERHARLYLLTGFEELAQSLAIAGGPALPVARIRLSKQEPITTRRLGRLRADPAAWKPVLEGKQAELRAKLEIERLLARLRRSLDETVLRPAQTSLQVARSVLATARARLSELGTELQGSAELVESKRVVLLEQLRGACPPSAQRRLSLAATRFRSAATVGSVAREIRVSIEALPQTMLVPKVRGGEMAESSPATYSVQPVLLRARVEQILIETLFPTLDEQLRQVFAEMAVTGARIREAIEICEHAIDAAVPDSAPDVRPALARAFERALTRLDEQLRTVEGGLESTAVGVRARAEAALHDIADVFEGGVEGAAAAPLVTNLWRSVGRHKSSMLGWTQRMTASVTRLLSGGPLPVGAKQPSIQDANAVRQQVASIVETAHLPPDYARLWQAEPVREHKLFRANRATLLELLESERSSLARGRGSALLIGSSGSGRTSLLNLCEVELSAPRVLRPEPLEGRRNIGIVGALAAELGLGDRGDGVAAALLEVRTTVLIDDLEQWFTPDAVGIAALSAFLELVVATDERVFWLVAVEQASLALLEEALPIRPAFTQLVGIAPLSASLMAEFVESRQAMSQKAVVYPSTPISRILGRFGFGDARGVFFRMLTRHSQGNLSAALLSWLRAARIDAEGTVVPEPYLETPVISSTLAQLPARQLAMLAQLARFGPFGESELSRYLELPESEIARHAHWFVSAGVLTREASSEARLTIAPRLKPMILGALRDAGTIR